LDCPYQFCGGIISAILGEIVLGVNNFGGQFPIFGGIINSHPNIFVFRLLLDESVTKMKVNRAHLPNVIIHCFSSYGKFFTSVLHATFIMAVGMHVTSPL